MYFKVFFIFTVMHILSSLKTLYKLLASNAFDDLKLHNFTYVTMKPADPSC